MCLMFTYRSQNIFRFINPTYDLKSILPLINLRVDFKTYEWSIIKNMFEGEKNNYLKN